MSWHDRAFPDPVAKPREDQALPVHSAQTLTQGGTLARIVLGDQHYTLRITRSGKLILTK